MNKAILTLISGALMASSAAFAAQQPASGKSVLKLPSAKEDNSVRSARKAILVLDKEIAKVDEEIASAKIQAATFKALPNDGVRSQEMQMLATSYEIQKQDLLRERENLQSVIQAE